MRILHHLFLASLCLVASARHESDVGKVDWHTKLIGAPLLDSAYTHPTIHDDLVLTATTQNVLAALNATDGSIVWRSIYEEEDKIFGFKIHESIVSTLSGSGGSTLRTYDLSSGSLILEKRFHSPSDGRVRNRSDGGVLLVPVVSPGGAVDSTEEDGDGTLLALTNGDTLRLLDAFSGNVQWMWESTNQSPLIRYTHVLPHLSTVYLAGYTRVPGRDASSPTTYTLHVTTLDLTTGEFIASVDMPARVRGVEDYMLLNSAASASSDSMTQTPCLAWLGSSPASTSTLHAAPLSPRLEGQVLHVPRVKYASIRDVGLAHTGQFIAVKEEGGAVQVMHYADKGLRSIWEFNDAAPSATHSESHFVGTRSARGETTIGRIYWSTVYGKVIHQTFVPQFSQDKGSVSGYGLPFATEDHGVVRHVACNTPSGSGNLDEKRLLLTTSTGSLQLWANDQLRWVREEGLAGVSGGVIEVVDLSGSGVIEGEKGVDVGDMEEEGFGEKVRRQLGDVKDFPAYAINFVTRFITGSSSVTPPPPTSTLSNVLNGTAYYPPLSTSSFTTSPKYNNNILILPTSPTPGTPSTKLFAIRASSGAVLWSRVLGLGWAGKVGGHVVPVKTFQRSAPSSRKGNLTGDKEVVLVTQRRADNGLVDTVVFHVDPLTGEDISWRYCDVETESEGDARNTERGPLEGVDVIQGPLIDAFVFPDEQGTVLLLDEFLQAYTYPSTPSAENSLAALAPSLHFALRAGTSNQAQILGHRLGKSEDLSKHWVAYPTWTVSFAPGEEIQSIVKRGQGAIASIGKVLGDRRTLYKYLNPHWSVVLTSLEPSNNVSRQCGVYLLDNVKGTVLYHVSLPAPERGEGQCEVKAVLEENWLVYSYFHDDGEDGEKGYRVVSVEMYEGSGPDEKIRSSDITSYSSEATAFTIYEQAYIMPHGITAIAPTRTKFGVSAKDIMVASRKNSIQAIPRRLLNPRRPKRKPTSEELEEMLIQYEAALPDDPRLVLSHLYEVASISHLTTFPSCLESTSLIFASGLDLFLTSVATSGTFDILSKGFNKMQLVLTVAGLAVGIGVTRPMVRRKRLRERWY